ncbi:MAG: hypothetical protein LWX56_09735 [Ignavibacteria bacterium]|nr:hypothetical protein [Ignavibacteria bacterium]
MKIRIVAFIVSLGCVLLWYGCSKNNSSGQNGNGPGGGDGTAQKEIAYNAEADQSIQEQNLAEMKRRAVNRFAGDTIDLMEYVLKSYPKGTYLMINDKTFRYNVPQCAVIYQKQSDGIYVYALIAKSKADDERVIEEKNVVGYDASFIDFDSTKLGTALFYLTLFHYNGNFEKVWETPVPTHGGFNRMTTEMWAKRKIPYIRINFHYAAGSGHIDYNYFLVDGMMKPPHLLMTYEGINMKRTMADVNNDAYPDYCEYLYYDTGDRVMTPDSVYFVWKDTAYFNVRNKKQWRKY